jgi:hypothetical protein
MIAFVHHVIFISQSGLFVKHFRFVLFTNRVVRKPQVFASQAWLGRIPIITAKCYAFCETCRDFSPDKSIDIILDFQIKYMIYFYICIRKI